MTPDFINLADRRRPLPVQTRMIICGQSVAGSDIGSSILADDAVRAGVSFPREINAILGR